CFRSTQSLLGCRIRLFISCIRRLPGLFSCMKLQTSGHRNTTLHWPHFLLLSHSFITFPPTLFTPGLQLSSPFF
ncbi:hypothetical protein L2E82_34960, partial [Cichorium intybus]